jgi:ParB family chromosome partitioning protein
MVSENEIRADLTPWERGRIAVTALEAEVFDTLDAAINTLYAPLDRFRRARLRAVAEVVMELGDHAFADPRALSQKQLTRLAFALRQGFSDLITATLAEAPNAAPDAQWKRLLPVLAEAEAEAKSPDTGPKYRPGRPRRMVHPRRALRIRRERTAEGWALRFTGPEATGPLMEDIMDHIERDYGQGA